MKAFLWLDSCFIIFMRLREQRGIVLPAGGRSCSGRLVYHVSYTYSKDGDKIEIVLRGREWRSLTEGGWHVKLVMVGGGSDDVRREWFRPSLLTPSGWWARRQRDMGHRPHQLPDQTQKVFPPCSRGHFHLSVRLSLCHRESVKGGCRWICDSG